MTCIDDVYICLGMYSMSEKNNNNKTMRYLLTKEKTRGVPNSCYDYCLCKRHELYLFLYQCTYGSSVHAACYHASQ